LERSTGYKVIMMQNWQQLSIDGRTLIPTIQMLHQAAQFVAMVSNSYLAKKEDDSQNNFNWNNTTSSLESQWIKIPTVRAILDIESFELYIDKYINLETLSLNGLTKEKVILDLQEALKTASVDSARLKPITQFSIPFHSVDDGLPFTKPANAFLNEWSRYLSNTQLLLQEIQSQFEWASDVRVWPHHFDMGLYIPVTRDGEGQDIQSIGLGLAIPDSYVSEPYFYINHWSKNAIEYPEHLPKLCCGYWNTKDWNGLVLPSSAVLAQSNQYQFAKDFFNEGINASLQLLKQATSSVTS